MTRRPRASRRARKAPRRVRTADKPVKAVQPDPLDGFIIAAANALGLKVEKRWLPAVGMNLRVTLRHGNLVAEFPLPDEAEPAPVFRA